LDDEKQIGVVRQRTALIADAAGDSFLTDRGLGPFD
jgi:hypothetical protein